MSRRVTLRHVYDARPEQLWAIATDFDCLAEAMRGLVRFEGLPEGGLHQGQVIDVRVSLFGILPAQPYRMELLEYDPEQMCFLSDEKGMGVDRWRHRMLIKASGSGAELIDEIEIDAGWRTGVLAAWARYMYGRRHKPRLAMLARQSAAS